MMSSRYKKQLGGIDSYPLKSLHYKLLLPSHQIFGSNIEQYGCTIWNFRQNLMKFLQNVARYFILLINYCQNWCPDSHTGVGNKPPTTKGSLDSNPYEDCTSNGSFLPYFSMHNKLFVCFFAYLFFLKLFWGIKFWKVEHAIHDILKERAQLMCQNPIS
jgi:hypothetical protein